MKSFANTMLAEGGNPSTELQLNSILTSNEENPYARVGKKCFLVFKRNKYLTIATDTIAFFYIKYEATMMMCFDRQEYFVSYSLDHIQSLLSDKQFFRLNRQYLINFQTIKDVEHYFARKLLVNPTIPVTEKLVVPKEKASNFLNWLDNR